MRKLLFSLFFILTSSIACANNLKVFNNRAIVEALAYHLDYTETGGNHRTLDEVYGFIPGAKVTIRKQIGQFIVEPSLAFKRGDLTYRGGINGSDTPFLTVFGGTENYLFNAEFILGYIGQINAKQNLVPYIQYGYRRWLREVPPIGTLTVNGSSTHIGVNSYTETYQNQFLMFGVEFQQEVSDKINAAVFVASGSTFNASLFTNLPVDVDNNSIRSIGTKDQLGSKPMYSVGIKTDYEFIDHWHVVLNATYQRFAYGKSKPVLGYLEPDSTTQDIAIGLGLAGEIV